MSKNKSLEINEFFPECSIDDMQQSNCFSHIGWEDSVPHMFYNYLIGYKSACGVLSKRYKEIPEYDNEQFDTFFYPIAYLNRHTVELWLKYFYFRYSHKNKCELIKFLKNGHDIKKSWEKVKYILEKPLKEQVSSIDLDDIEKLICYIHEFDKSSMENRYPIDKKLIPMHPEEIRLDLLKIIVNFEKLFANFDEIEETISGKVNLKTIDNDLKERFLSEYNNSKQYIDGLTEVLKIRDLKTPSSNTSGKEIFTVSDLDLNRLKKNMEYGDKDVKDFIEKTPNNSLVVLFLIIQAAGCSDRLSIKQPERQDDFLKLMNSCKKERESIEFDSKSKNLKDDVYKYLFFKTSDFIMRYLNKAIEILNEM